MIVIIRKHTAEVALLNGSGSYGRGTLPEFIEILEKSSKLVALLGKIRYTDYIS